MSRSVYAILNSRFGNPVDHITRRDMLKATLAASAGLLISGPAAALPGAFRRAHAAKRVVVIGAGFGGLACAHELASVGYDVTVVEARDRLGGRVLSFSDLVPGKNVEGGAELIGSNHPTWVSYAEKFGLEFLDVTEDEGEVGYPVVIDGKPLSEEEAGSVWEQMEAALNGMNALAEPVIEDEPWKTPDAAALDKRSIQTWIDELQVDELTKKAVAINQTADNGQLPSNQSLLGQLSSVKGGGLDKYWTESEVYRCKGGNQQLATKLAEAIGRDRIVLGLPVISVSTRGQNMLVTCKDGRTIECDDVVLAVPPAVWSKIEFSPALPGSLKPQMGVNVKYLAHVKKRFWKEANLSQYALGNGPVHMTWEGTDNQEGDDNACLVAFSGGPSATQCLGFSKEARDKEYGAILSKFYPTMGDFFVKSRFMDWPRDPWTMASYSFPAPGQVTTHGPMLAAGLGRLHFAGEHTCYKFVGYMEGGLNSGVTVAKRLAVRDGAVSR